MGNKSFELQRGNQENQLGEKFRKDYLPIPEETERVASMVVNAAYVVHKTLGAGLLESVYETCFCYELQKRGLKFERNCSAICVASMSRRDKSLPQFMEVGKSRLCSSPKGFLVLRQGFQPAEMEEKKLA